MFLLPLLNGDLRDLRSLSSNYYRSWFLHCFEDTKANYSTMPSDLKIRVIGNNRRFFAVPTTARGNRRDQPIDLNFRLGKSCTCQIRPSFSTCTAVHSRGNPLHVKSGRPYRHARPTQWCEVGYFCEVGCIPYLVYHYVLFLRSDVPGILAMHLRSRKDNAKPEKCYETCRATTR